jgi:hypothetical protein
MSPEAPEVRLELLWRVDVAAAGDLRGLVPLEVGVDELQHGRHVTSVPGVVASLDDLGVVARH